MARKVSGMIRSVAGKVMWVGRATVFLVGLAVVLALTVGAVSRATAHTGSAGLFHLGHSNAASAISGLVGTVSGGVLQVTNNSTATTATGVGVTNKSGASPAVRATNSGGGPALGLNVASGKAPMTVSGGAAKVTNLDADKLDGKDASAFLSAHGVYQKISPLTSGTANGSTSGFLACDAGDKALSGGYEVRGEGYEVDSDTVNLKGVSGGVPSAGVPSDTGYYYLLWQDTDGTAEPAFMNVVCLDVGAPHQ